MKLQCSIADKDVSRVRKFLGAFGKSQSKALYNIINDMMVAKGEKPLTIITHGGNRKKSPIIKKGKSK